MGIYKASYYGGGAYEERITLTPSLGKSKIGQKTRHQMLDPVKKVKFSGYFISEFFFFQKNLFFLVVNVTSHFALAE
jgi:hypothetical protein